MVTLYSGPCSLTADQAGNTDYSAALQVSGDITVDRDYISEASAAIIEDIAGNANGVATTAKQINLIAGVRAL